MHFGGVSEDYVYKLFRASLFVCMCLWADIHTVCVCVWRLFVRSFGRACVRVRVNVCVVFTSLHCSFGTGLNFCKLLVCSYFCISIELLSVCVVAFGCDVSVCVRNGFIEYGYIVCGE